MTALRYTNRLWRSIGAVTRHCALAASFLLLGGCVSSGDMPGMPWLLWATIRSLAGAPPAPPDFFAEPVRVSDTLRFTAITAGEAHTCALTFDGDTYCWGSNRYEQLGSAAVTETCGSGPGAFSCSSTPVRLEEAPRFTALAASLWSTCGLDAAGAAYCWGYGLGGRNGDPLPASSGVPVKVPGGHEFLALASSPASNGGTCGLAADGRVWCWGLNNRAVGGGPGVFVGPDPVLTSLRFVSIGWGGAHGCGIDEERNAYCWGSNQAGQLGAVGMRESRAPVPVQGRLELEQIVTGGAYSCGLETGGSAYCWGLGFPADPGGPPFRRTSGDPLPHGSVPVPIETTGAEWIALSAGNMQTCALTVDGEVYCFRVTPMQGVDKRPIRIESDDTFVKLAVGGLHACAIGADALAYCWGRSHAAQVGRPPDGR